MRTHHSTRSDAGIARAVAALFLISTGAYIVGSGMVPAAMTGADFLPQVAANASETTLGVLFQLLNNAAVIVIGLLFYPIAMRYNATIAIGYLVTRLVEALLLSIGALSALALVTLSQTTIASQSWDTPAALTAATLLVATSQDAFTIAMLALGLGSLPLCYLLYQTRLIPPVLALLGLVGYAALPAGSVAQLLGVDLQMLHFLPGGLFEFLLPLWLLVRGFNPSPAVRFATVAAGGQP